MSNVELLNSVAGQMITERAKELALIDGHKNVDEIIVLKGGRRIPVWQFYVKSVLRT